MIDLIIVAIVAILAITVIYYVVHGIATVVKAIGNWVSDVAESIVDAFSIYILPAFNYWYLTLPFLAVEIYLFQSHSVFGESIILLIYLAVIYTLVQRKKKKIITQNIIDCIEEYGALPVGWADVAYLRHTKLYDTEEERGIIEACFQNLLKKGRIEEGTSYQDYKFYYKDDASLQETAKKLLESLATSIGNSIVKTGIFQFDLQKHSPVNAGLKTFENLFFCTQIPKAMTQFVSQYGGSCVQTNTQIVILSKETLDNITHLQAANAIKKVDLSDVLPISDPQVFDQVFGTICDSSKWIKIGAEENEWLLLSTVMKQIEKSIKKAPLSAAKFIEMFPQLDNQHINSLIRALATKQIMMADEKKKMYLIDSRQKGQYFCKKCHKFFVHLQDYGPDGYCRSCQKELEEEGEQVRRYVYDLPPGIKIKT